jgi:hypothetical protein
MRWPTGNQFFSDAAERLNFAVEVLKNKPRLAFAKRVGRLSPNGCGLPQVRSIWWPSAMALLL